jgi:acyl-CoA thioester hydrolase
MTPTPTRPDADAPETRERFPFFLKIPTRWMDNDIYGHVNNVVYYSYFDTVINKYLIDAGGLDIAAGPSIGLAVETRCQFKRPLTFPVVVDAGLRVGKLGNSSVRYEIGLFAEGELELAASGHFVHVFVERESRRPTPIPPGIRTALLRLCVPAAP